MQKYLMGFDIGGTKSAVVLGEAADSGIAILERVAFATGNGFTYTLDMLEDSARAILTNRGLQTSDISAIGISCGGPLNSRSGVVLGPPNLPGWDNVPITKHFEDRLQIPTRLQNDANACALAEWKWGAGRGFNNMIFLTFGTGLGAGFILDGRLYSGASDLAGEVGHVRLAEDGPLGYGKRGSFEGFCSGGGIARLAREAAEERISLGESVSFCQSTSDLEQITAQMVFESARAGDSFALELVDIVARHLGRGLAILIDTLNPDAIIIGSIFTRAHDLLWPATEQSIKAEAVSLSAGVCKVLPAALGEEIGDYACLSVASEG